MKIMIMMMSNEERCGKEDKFEIFWRYGADSTTKPDKV